MRGTKQLERLLRLHKDDLNALGRPLTQPLVTLIKDHCAYAGDVILVLAQALPLCILLNPGSSIKDNTTVQSSPSKATFLPTDFECLPEGQKRASQLVSCSRHGASLHAVIRYSRLIDCFWSWT